MPKISIVIYTFYFQAKEGQRFQGLQSLYLKHKNDKEEKVNEKDEIKYCQRQK